MPISKEILDELIKDYRNPEDLLGEQGLLKQLTKALLGSRLDKPNCLLLFVNNICSKNG